MESTLSALPAPAATSDRMRLAGRVVSALPVLFLGFDSVVKFTTGIPAVAEANAHLGIDASATPIVGAIELACLALYLVPRTAALGAILLTGYFGGAIFAHLRVADPLATHTLFPIWIAALVWGGLYLRDARVRALLSPAR
jgi:hypothetical protein